MIDRNVNDPLTDGRTLRERARTNLERGALTESYAPDVAQVRELLNRALATELVCSLRYQRHYHLATGLHAEPVAREFAEHAAEERDHAEKLAARIVQLGGQPDYDPAGLADRSHALFGSATDLREMVRENLLAERVAIDSYREMIKYVGNEDPTTRRMLEDILASEEEHADELAGLLDG